jgi:phosphoenolpyruvate carboxykinase (GTP)
MAMLPFCGYNMADYFQHWLDMRGKLTRPPAVFHVNWFRTGPDGRFLWPGFGQNLRVLLWMIDRVKGKGAAEETPIGLVPGEGGIDFDGLDLTKAEQDALLRVERDQWAAEVPEIRAFFERFGDRIPEPLVRSLDTLAQQLATTTV